MERNGRGKIPAVCPVIRLEGGAGGQEPRRGEGGEL